MKQETSISAKLTQPASINRTSKSDAGRFIPMRVLVFIIAVMTLAAAVYFFS